MFNNLMKMFNPRFVVKKFISDKTDKLLGDQSSLINSYKKDNFKTIVLDGYGHTAYDFAPNYKELIYNFFKGE